MPKSTEQNTQSGLVISYFGNSVAVEADDGQVFQCHLRRNQELPVVGDRVRWQLEADNTGLVIEIEPRQSLLSRGSRGEGRGKSKALAANIDALLVVMSPPPIFSEYLIDRYMVAAELLGIHPILVLNKEDLLSEACRAATLERLQAYRNIPYPAILSSTYTKNGLDELAELIKGKMAVLVGPSGVGKSSIISALGNHDAIQVGEVSAKGTGKHTTTATRLYHLPQGGRLIDSPGVREFNLWQISQQDVLRGFKEFKPFLGQCRFRDCVHMAEPGCAVQQACTDGIISGQRYASYQELMKEAALYKKY